MTLKVSFLKWILYKPGLTRKALSVGAEGLLLFGHETSDLLVAFKFSVSYSSISLYVSVPDDNVVEILFARKSPCSRTRYVVLFVNIRGLGNTLVLVLSCSCPVTLSCYLVLLPCPALLMHHFATETYHFLLLPYPWHHLLSPCARTT
jgi:hypothetical protein